MPEKKGIEKISDHVKEVILRKSSYGLPTRPTAHGMQESDIKKAFYAPILDEEYSVLAEMDRITEETNTVLTEIQEDTNALQAKHDAFVEKATKDRNDTNLCIYSLAYAADELKIDFKDLSRDMTKYKEQVNTEIERLEGKLDTGIDQKEVERNVVKAVVPLINKETIGIDKVDNTADIDKPVSTLQQEAITRATSIAKAELTESFKQNIQASLVALNDSLLGEIAKKEESLTEKITAEQTARVEEDTNIKNSITEMQEELQTKDTSLEEQLQTMQTQLTQMQEQFTALQQDREEILQEAKLQAYPIGITIYSEDANFDPIRDIGGNWIEVPAPIINFNRAYSVLRISNQVGGDFYNIKQFIAEYDGSITISGRTERASDNTIWINRKSQNTEHIQIERAVSDGVAGRPWESSAHLEFLKGDLIEFQTRNITVNYDASTVIYYKDNAVRSGKAWKRTA